MNRLRRERPWYGQDIRHAGHGVRGEHCGKQLAIAALKEADSPSADQAKGRRIFTHSCAGCHGPRGEGGRGPNLRNRGVWHSLEDQDLFQTIQKGVPGADMPATNLPDEQIWQLAAFVKALSAPAIESKPPAF